MRTVDDWCRLLQYPDEWIALGFVDESFVLAQAAEYERSGDRDIEHYKWAAYRRQLASIDPSDRSAVERFIVAMEADPNPHLFKGAIAELIATGVPRQWFLSHPDARFLTSNTVRARLGVEPLDAPERPREPG
jgi:hypothetical protein